SKAYQKASSRLRPGANPREFHPQSQKFSQPGRITFTPPSRHIAFIGDYTQISNFRVFYDFSKHPFGGISTQQQHQQRIGKVSHACHYHHIEVHSQWNGRCCEALSELSLTCGSDTRQRPVQAPLPLHRYKHGLCQRSSDCLLALRRHHNRIKGKCRGVGWHGGPCLCIFRHACEVCQRIKWWPETPGEKHEPHPICLSLSHHPELWLIYRKTNILGWTDLTTRSGKGLNGL
ncbi:hypothetical protein CABS03_00899, partial [Colletotrichum abscissum]